MKYTPAGAIKWFRGKWKKWHKFWFMVRYGVPYIAFQLKERDYDEKPVTVEEHKTQDRFTKAKDGYNEIKNDPIAFAQLKEEWQQSGIGNSVYTYYIHCCMKKMKEEGPLAADPTQFKRDWSLKKHN